MKKNIVKKYKNAWKFLPLVLGILVILIYTSCSWVRHEAGGIKFSLPFGRIYDYNNILVVYVVDGDTIKLEDGSWVRLIGIDTPEYYESDKLFRDARNTHQDIATIKKMGAMSCAFTKEMLENRRVRLEFDVERRDKYGRLLAYVFLPDGTFANAEIVEHGYARVYSIPPNLKYVDLLRNAEQKAKAQNQGLWGMDFY